MDGLHYPVEGNRSGGWHKPGVYIQWKGTDACFDLHCICDTEEESAGVGHFDGYFASWLKCVRCGRVYEMPHEIPIRLLGDDETPPYNNEPVEVHPDE